MSGELIEIALAVITGLIIGFVVGEAWTNRRWMSATLTLKQRGLFINRRASR